MSARPRVIPFRVGGPIQDPADFIGRKEVLREILGGMLNLQNLSLHGERRTGKTSLLLFLAHPASSSATGLPGTHIPVYFNFQEFTEARVTRVWRAMASAIAEQIKQRHPDRRAESGEFLATMAESLSSPDAPELLGTSLGRALGRLDASGLKIHLLLDEFEQTARNPGLGDSFYDALRSLPTRAENISYVIATRTGLATLQPAYDKISSPFFNIFTRTTLGPFKEDEVHHLIFDYLARAGLDISLAERLCTESEFLYEVTGYHPFFLQMLCYHLCASLDRPDWPLGQARQEALRAFEKDSEEHFEFYWNISSEEEQGLIQKLAVGQSIAWDRMGPVVRELQDRCLLVHAEPGWQLFSSSFAKWVQDQQLAAWYEEGIAQLTEGKFEQAKEILEKVYAVYPDYRDVQVRFNEAKRWLRLEELQRQAEASLLAQNWQEAIEVFEELLELDPRDANAITRLKEARRQLVLDDLYREGMEHFDRQRWQQARNAFERVTRLEPNYRDAEAKLEFARERSGRSSPVIELLRDPIWQGIGVVVAFIIAVSLFIMRFVRNPVEPAPTPDTVTLCNGDFRRNFECWQHGGELDQSVECDGDQCYAVLGNPSYACLGGVPVGEAWIKQSFKVPLGISPTLSLRYRIFSYDLDLPDYDYFQVVINGEPLPQRYGNYEWNEPSCDREPWDSGWQDFRFDLSAYQGQELALSLHNTNGTHRYYNTWTHIDDIRVDEVHLPSPTPTSSPSPTPTPYLMVSTERLYIYAGPGEIYELWGEVHRGDQMPLRGCSEDGLWWQVEYLGRKGWVRAQAVGANIEPTLLPTVEAPPTPVTAPTPMPTMAPTPSLPENTLLDLQNPGFESVQENVIPGWRWWAADNYPGEEYDAQNSFDTPFFSQTENPALVIDGATLQIEATAFLNFKVHVFQTASAPPAVTVRFQASAKAYSGGGGIKLAAGVDPNGGPDCRQARWGDTLTIDQSNGTVQLVAPSVVVGRAGQVTICLRAENVLPTRSNAAFFDNAALIANPK